MMQAAICTARIGAPGFAVQPSASARALTETVGIGSDLRSKI